MFYAPKIEVLQAHPLPEDAPMTEQFAESGICDDAPEIDNLSSPSRVALKVGFNIVMTKISDALKLTRSAVKPVMTVPRRAGVPSRS